MNASTVVGYSFDSDNYCVDCARHLYRQDQLDDPDTCDHWGNPLHPVFASSEYAEDAVCCECGEELT